MFRGQNRVGPAPETPVATRGVGHDNIEHTLARAWQTTPPPRGLPPPPLRLPPATPAPLSGDNTFKSHGNNNDSLYESARHVPHMPPPRLPPIGAGQALYESARGVEETAVGTMPMSTPYNNSISSRSGAGDIGGSGTGGIGGAGAGAGAGAAPRRPLSGTMTLDSLTSTALTSSSSSPPNDSLLLSDLRVSTGKLRPPFHPLRRVYVLIVPEDTGQVRFKPRAHAAHSIVTVDQRAH